MNQNTEYKDWDKTLCYLVDNGCFDDARKIAYTYIKQYQADETFVILFILFQISDAENSAGEYNIFSSPASGTTEALIKHYTQIKFCLRRYEYDMPEEALEEAFGSFIENKVSVNALYRISQFACVNTAYVYKRLAQAFRNKGMDAQADVFENL